MDSGNSGSMQSSSGGDEEYDSRAESNISAFLNNNPPPQQQQQQQSHVGSFHHLNPPQHHHHIHMFDPLSNYLDPIQRPTSQYPNTNSLLNLDMVWSKAARSEPNQTNLGSLIPCSSSQQNQGFLLSQLAGQTRGVNVGAFPTTQHSLLPQESVSRGGLISVSATNDQAHNNSTNTNTNTSMVRNPKKRSRASRRAPTTVLTTDTTNFRAMVQEFTGIPAPPFPSSSSFPRTRLDLFGSVATSALRSVSTHLEPPPPPYLLRPFAQKVHPFQPSSNPMVDTLASNNSTTNNTSTNSTSINYQQQQQHLSVNNNNSNMHNPILSFQSFLQPPPKYPLGNSSVLASKTQPSSLEITPNVDHSHLKMGVLDELGLMRHAQVNTNVGCLHQNMVPSSSDGALSMVNNNNNMRNPSAEWAQRTSTITNNDGDQGGVLRSLNGIVNYSSSNIQERVSNGKVNFSASPSDFHGEKGPECVVAARSEA
ncbi:uncharacterized protein LOC133283698 isoform X2 [Gastrolobium bilobum]|uniref:uncharacterized protein LOC133283698 isoform X2 n=1 Tax=Gastrolobium bilobum TaxID=150636 RepID=UPI002AB0D3CC|nr:uncharacterized protein LOC133283698 isoform X2 [Gastrolobium bilobum]